MSKVTGSDRELPIGYTAIKHISRKLKQICNEETSVGYAKVPLDLSNLVHLSFKEIEKAALSCTWGS